MRFVMHNPIYIYNILRIGRQTEHSTAIRVHNNNNNNNDSNNISNFIERNQQEIIG